MLNGQIKPAYNIQFASSGAFLIGVRGNQKVNDLHTLKPFLEKMMNPYAEHLMNILADAGYESTENYTYLNGKQLRPYIKPANYERQRKKKYKKDISKKESMTYLEDENVCLCKSNKKLVRAKRQNSQLYFWSERYT